MSLSTVLGFRTITQQGQQVRRTTFRLIELLFLVFRGQLETRRFVSTNPFEASKNDLGSKEVLSTDKTE